MLDYTGGQHVENPNKRKVKFITDSGCDLPEGYEMLFGIDIVSFEVTLDDVTYNERVDIKPKEFYELMNASQNVPVTNQIIVPRWEEKFRQHIAAGEKEVIVVTINSKGSQTYFNAVQAKKNLLESGELGDMVLHIVDSRTYSIGYGYALVEAIKKYDAGETVEQILAYLDDWFSCMEIYLFPLNLRHMKKSGRITAAAAVVGGLMGLCPVISLIDGVSTVLKKVRGEKALLEEAAKVIKESIGTNPWTGLIAEDEEFYGKLKAKLTEDLGSPPVFEAHMGCVVSTNTGPKVAAILAKGKHRGAMKYD
jgi:DegV family protein with EDD domain